MTKLTADGWAVVYSTYLGGSADDHGWDIAVDASGRASVTGPLVHPIFPPRQGPSTRTFNGADSDAFVTTLAADGSALVYSTYLGGSADDSGQGIAVDASGSAYVTGSTLSPNFPATPGAFDGPFNASSRRVRDETHRRRLGVGLLDLPRRELGPTMAGTSPSTPQAAPT